MTRKRKRSPRKGSSSRSPDEKSPGKPRFEGRKGKSSGPRKPLEAKVKHLRPADQATIETRMTGAEREAVARARRRTELAIKDWLQAADQQARKPRPDLQDRSLMERLDPWQREALEALLNGEHVVVDAPTTAGKTRVVEAFFELNVDQSGFRAAYTTPVKSLSNDKLREFTEQFGKEQVGIATGDIKENLSAPIVVATLESYRNSLLGVEPDLGRSLVVFDEYHFMQDTGRGSAWEEAIILTPPTCQLLLLSASVENAEAFCAWIQQITHRSCRLIRTTERPVPLVGLVYHREQWLLIDEAKDILPRKGLVPTRFPLEQGELARRLKGIPQMGLTPCLVYAGRRMACETLAMEICNQLEPIPREEAQALKQALEEDREVEDLMKFLKPNLRRMLLVYGVGYHHSGLAPVARRAIERLVKQGHLRFCVATMGLSIGINFSVRAALISDYTRPGELGFTAYSPSEVLQMLGRAGRRGRDMVGFSLWPSVASYHKLAGAKREDCESRLKNDPTTFLGLLGRGFKLRDVENFYEKSFLRFSNRSVQFTLVRDTLLKRAIDTETLPCLPSPAAAYSSFLQDDSASRCQPCPYRSACHRHIKTRMSNPLAQLHLHLHRLGCIDDQEQLTRFGSIARYFPQSGGLLVAFLIDQGDIQLSNLLAGAELMGALCLTRFKEPGVHPQYDFPFDARKVEEALEKFYPLELFEELYDPPGPRRDTYLFREYNPLGGFIVSEWIKGVSWADLVKRATDEKFGQGDLMALLYRAATYLQSLTQARVPGLSQAAMAMRDQILREPLTPAVRAEAEPTEDSEIEDLPHGRDPAGDDELAD